MPKPVKHGVRRRSIHILKGSGILATLNGNSCLARVKAGLKQKHRTRLRLSLSATRKQNEQTGSSAIFINFSRGVETTRDVWLYNFDPNTLKENIDLTITTYNEHVQKWLSQQSPKPAVDSFVGYDDKRIKWSRRLKERLVAGELITLNNSAFKSALYRPFTCQSLYFENSLVYLPALFPRIFPTQESQDDNKVICFTAPGSEKPFMVLCGNGLVDLHL